MASETSGDGGTGRASDAAPETAPVGKGTAGSGPVGGGSAGGGSAGGDATGGGSVRVDSWIWSVRLAKTRSAGSAACKGGHVRVNGDRVKAAHGVHVGDEVRVRQPGGRERVVIVKRLIRKRVGAPVAVECYVDNSPPPPPREAVAPAGIRDRGTGRPTKRDRREMERLRGAEG
ncbi:RNA-binding S4 domain-containing protein [Streptomyces sp. NPDC058308]|uniref:RNA-binding S4 domain-containing protein n=1 Tax=Streptomyces sp. NPDC058308 TaxID=3346440 RepID=UPI0036E84E23